MKIAPRYSFSSKHKIIRVYFFCNPRKEVNGDYNVDGSVIPDELVWGVDSRSRLLNFKPETIIEQDLVMAKNTGEVCVRFRCKFSDKPEIDVLIPACIIEKIEVEETSQNKEIYDDVFKLTSQS